VDPGLLSGGDMCTDQVAGLEAVVHFDPWSDKPGESVSV
jgi:hypothetical protein